MKHLLLVSLTFLGFYLATAQSSSTLHLQSGDIRLSSRVDWQNEYAQSPAFEGKKYLIVQFTSLPTEAQKEALHNLGVDLLYYLPDYAWFVSINENSDLTQLKGFPIHAISYIFKQFKLTPSLYQSYLKLTGGTLSSPKALTLEITTFAIENEEAALQKCRDIGAINVQKGEYPHTFTLEISENQLASLAGLPFIYFITEQHPEAQKELTYRNTVGRANYLSSGINGMNYNGAGVTLAIEESDILDTLSIDFQGRKKERVISNVVNGHKTGCFENAGSAGNYDPKYRANAWGANIMSINSSTWSYYDTAQLRMASHSYGWGVSGGYWSGARDHDQQVRMQPSMMHFYSSGNQGSDTCNYGIYNGIAAWANLTGGSKQAKNIMAINNTSPYDSLSFGSVGPAFDGRIKPDLCIEGWEGTSYSSPKAAGMMAQLYQVWKSQHNGTDPQSGLIKAFMLNTADDLYNPGPDFRTGFGRINARRAYKSIQANSYFVDSVANGMTKQHTLAIPANVKEVRVMLYWTDYEATVNAAKALINDLNLRVISPSNASYMPWTLNLFPHADSLDNPAKRGNDSLNNVEQITIANPAAGNYSLTVNGHLVPQGPQKYWIVYEFLYNELTLTYPIGKEHFVAGENEIIRWDNYGGTGTLSVDFSTDNGTTWTNIVANLPSGQTQYKWTVPAIMTGQAKIRVQRNGLQSVSMQPFNIMPVPQNLHRVWSCSDSLMLKWDAVNGATAYRITRLGQKYMDSVGVTTSTHFKISNANTNAGEWLSVQAYGPQNALSRRALAWHWLAGDTNCVPFDASLMQVLPYKSGYYPDCYTDHKRLLKGRLQNNGLNTITNAALKYQLDGGTIFTSAFAGNLVSADDIGFAFTDSIASMSIGTHYLKVWVNLAGDTNHANDTMKSTIIVYPSTTVNINYVQDFDAFTNCSTAWGCEAVVCGLSGGWYNIPNTPTIMGDSIDWRTLSGATGTGGTGPDFDHTTGTNTGKYLYLESSSTNGSGCQYKEAKLQSTCIDLGGTNMPTLDFWYHAYGSTIGTFNLDVLGDEGWKNNVMAEVSGDHGNVWLNQQVNLNDFVGEEIVLDFRAKTGGGYTADFAIDDITFTTLPQLMYMDDSVEICSGTGPFFQSTYATNATTYTWSFPPSVNVQFLNGTNLHSTSIEYTFNAPTPGYYNLLIIAGNATGSDTAIQVLHINPAPNITIVANSSSICEGETLILNASMGGLQAITYSWYQNNTLVGTSATLTIPQVSMANAGGYNCNVQHVCGTNLGNALNITVNPLPIVSLGNDITMNTADTVVLAATPGFPFYQWNNQAGNNSPTYTIIGPQILTAGIYPYFVTVTDANGCKDSDTILVNVDIYISISPYTNPQDVKLYPNPNQGTFYLSLNAAAGQNLSLQLFDITGKKVGEESYIVQQDTPHVFNQKQLAKGVYTLVLAWGQEKRVMKVLVE